MPPRSNAIWWKTLGLPACLILAAVAVYLVLLIVVPVQFTNALWSFFGLFVFITLVIIRTSYNAYQVTKTPTIAEQLAVERDELRRVMLMCATKLEEEPPANREPLEVARMLRQSVDRLHDAEAPR